MDLKPLGWHPYFEAQFSGFDGTGLIPARVIRQDKQGYTVHDGKTERPAVLAGKFYVQTSTAEELPAVGDWVAIAQQSTDDRVMIRELIPRRSKFLRKAAGEVTQAQVVAANIDTVFIVTGLDRDFNPRRIERYLTLTYDSGARPVIVLNKSDLHDDPTPFREQVEAVAFGIDILIVSAKNEQGLNALQEYLNAGETVAFIGSSGVGKSSLINQILGEEYMTVREVREEDQRGRHTTTHRELIQLSNGAMMIDTPGMRELQLWASEEHLQNTFEDIEAIATSCRFADCSHRDEPGCAVQAALESGDLDENRFGNYMKMRSELAYLEMRKGPDAKWKMRQKDRALGKMYKEIMKGKKKKD